MAAQLACPVCKQSKFRNQQEYSDHERTCLENEFDNGIPNVLETGPWHKASAKADTILGRETSAVSQTKPKPTLIDTKTATDVKTDLVKANGCGAGGGKPLSPEKPAKRSVPRTVVQADRCGYGTHLHLTKQATTEDVELLLKTWIDENKSCTETLYLVSPLSVWNADINELVETKYKFEMHGCNHRNRTIMWFLWRHPTLPCMVPTTAFCVPGVSVFLFDNIMANVLLVEEGGRLKAVTGNCDFGELPCDTAVRETKEELNIDIGVNSLIEFPGFSTTESRWNSVYDGQINTNAVFMHVLNTSAAFTKFAVDGVEIHKAKWVSVKAIAEFVDSAAKEPAPKPVCNAADPPHLECVDIPNVGRVAKPVCVLVRNVLKPQLSPVKIATYGQQPSCGVSYQE